MKKILFGDEARNKIRVGIDMVANAIKITMGAQGRNAMSDKRYSYNISNDGAFIAGEIQPTDRFEAMGAMVVREASLKTNKEAGDGTSTTALLTQAFINEAEEAVQNGMSRMDVRKKILEEAKIIVDKLKALATPAETLDALKKVANLSVESQELGTIVAETVFELGKESTITTADSNTDYIEVEKVKGMRFDRGYVTQYFMTNLEKKIAELKSPKIFVSTKRIDNSDGIVKFMETCSSVGITEVLFICDEATDAVIVNLVDNKVSGAFKSVLVRAPGTGERRLEMLRDICAVTGATLYDDTINVPLANLTYEILGSSDSVVVTADHTTIIGGHGTKEAVDLRITQLEEDKKTADSEFEKLKINERISKLTGGIGIIKVGAPVDSEVKYLKHKIDDAINAVQSAWQEGIIPGGGSTLAHIAKTSPEVTILKRALSEPLRQMLRNGDVETVVSQEIENLQSGKFNSGYNQSTRATTEDLITEGIIDPVKVTRCAVQNAASTAATFITTDVAIGDFPDRE